MKVLDELEEVQSNDDEEGKNKISIDRKKTEGNQ